MADKMFYRTILIITNILFSVLCLYLIYYSYNAHSKLENISKFFQENPEHAIKYSLYDHINPHVLQYDSSEAVTFTILLDDRGCPTCIQKETRLLNEFWGSLDNSTNVFLVGDTSIIPSVKFPYQRISPDSAFVDPDFASNPLFILHSGPDVHSIRLADPTQYGYHSWKGEYLEHVSRLLAPQEDLVD